MHVLIAMNQARRVVDMNERIKLLADKATSIVESPPNREGWTSSYAYFDKEKFAELIVKECIQACINEGRTFEVASAGEYSSNLYATAIRKHFGVEE